MRKIIMAAALGCAIGARAQEQTKWEWVGYGGGGLFWSAAWDPSNVDTLYMGGDVVGAYKTTDRGKTWRIINNGLQNHGVFTLAVAKANPNVVYAMTDDGIARSDNKGDVWKPLAETRAGAKNISTLRHQTVRGIAVDPRDAKVLYAGSGKGEAHKSRDAGETWERLDFLSAMPQEGGGGPAGARGKGFMWLRYAAGANDWSKHGRVQKFFNAPDNWEGFDTFSAKLFAPADAPQLSVTVIAQTGDNWQWHESGRVDLKPGEWTEAALDLAGVANPGNIRIAYLSVWANGFAFEGDIGIDDVRVSAKDGRERVIGDFETPGDLDGWVRSESAEAGFAVDAFSSLGAVPHLNGPVASVVVSEANPDLVFVCHRKLGLFRSADGGKTWTKPDTHNNVSHVAVSAKDGNIVYGAFDKAGLWKSTDAGVTWKRLESAEAGTCNYLEIVLDPRDANVAHVIAMQGWGSWYGRTRDGGATWENAREWKRDADSNRTLVQDLNAPTGLSMPTNLTISPTEPDHLFVSANWNVFMTHDSGDTWIERNTGADITCFHDFRIVGDNVFAVGMDVGLFQSTNNGATWRHLAPKQWEAGLSGHMWRVLAWPRGDTHKIITTVTPWADRGVEFPNFTLITEDGGKTFSRGKQGLPDYLSRNHTMWEHTFARALAADPVDPDILWLGMDGAPEEGKMGGGLFKSVDGGHTWKQLPNQPESRCIFNGLAVDPTNRDRIYWGAGDQANKTGVFGVWVSEDGGDSWTKTEVNEWVFNIEVSPSGHVYAGGNQLWQSLDHGKTWKKLTDFNGHTTLGIAIDPDNEKRIWVSNITWGGGGNERGGVFRSDDLGATWTDISGDIPNRTPYNVRWNPATKELWAAGPGVFKTKQ